MKTLILAPHIDDELIGCYTILEDFRHGPKEDSLDVLWLNDATPERLSEGQQLAGYYGFTGAAVFRGQASLILETNHYDKVYVPHRQDWHFDHKTVNCLFREYATNFYSVDMVQGIPMSCKDQANKKRLLDRFYPSQASLWARDAKYYLFSSVHDSDVTEYTKKKYAQFTITAPTECWLKLNQLVLLYLNELNEGDKWAITKLVGQVKHGDFVYEHIDGKIFKA